MKRSLPKRGATGPRKMVAVGVRNLLPLVAAVAVFVASGCGGGTSGTGVDDSDVQITSTEGNRVLTGAVVRADGSPIHGAIVRSVASGEQVATGSDGQFVLEVPETGEPFVLEVVIGDQMAVVQFESNLEAKASVDLQITINDELGVAQIEISQSGEVSLFSEVPVETSVKEILL